MIRLSVYESCFIFTFLFTRNCSEVVVQDKSDIWEADHLYHILHLALISLNVSEVYNGTYSLTTFRNIENKNYLCKWYFTLWLLLNSIFYFFAFSFWLLIMLNFLNNLYIILWYNIVWLKLIICNDISSSLNIYDSVNVTNITKR